MRLRIRVARPMARGRIPLERRTLVGVDRGDAAARRRPARGCAPRWRRRTPAASPRLGRAARREGEDRPRLARRPCRGCGRRPGAPCGRTCARSLALARTATAPRRLALRAAGRACAAASRLAGFGRFVGLLAASRLRLAAAAVSSAAASTAAASASFLVGASARRRRLGARARLGGRLGDLLSASAADFAGFLWPPACASASAASRVGRAGSPRRRVVGSSSSAAAHRTLPLPAWPRYSARRRELAELVADHRLRHEHGHVLAAVVDGDRVADHLGEDRRGPRPGLDHGLGVGRCSWPRCAPSGAPRPTGPSWTSGTSASCPSCRGGGRGRCSGRTALPFLRVR